MQSYGLKIKIILALVIFIGAAMLLIDVVVSMGSHKKLLVAEMDKAEVVARVLAQSLGDHEQPDSIFLHQLAEQAQPVASDLVIVAADGTLQFHKQPEGQGSHELEVMTRRVALAKVMERGMAGSRLGLLGPRYDFFLAAVPVRNSSGKVIAGLGLSVELSSLYERFFASQQLIALYFLLNLTVLTFLAYQRMVKLLIKPLQRLVKRAEEYQDDESFYFLSDRKGDDVAALSSSLNRMLSRINTDRKKLQDMVTALEEANASLRQAQQEVIRAEKLASVGRLSAGIAHEIGNPVGIVLGYLELLKQEGLAPAERLDFISRAMAEISRINTIIRQLLDLARSSDEEQAELHIHALLADLQAGLKDQPLLAAMTIEVDLAAADDRVVGVADRLRQVFVNIIMNAADALRDRGGEQQGLLAITTSVITAQLQGGAPEQQALQISFADNGPGIAADNLEAIFDPFFTTKEPGKGTGLGLSVSYMIIENAQGSISAAARPEGGSVFTVLLPLAHPEQGSGK